MSQGLDLLAKAVLAFLVLSILAAAYPFRPWEPLWFLKLSQIAIDYGVSYLLAVFLAKLCNYFLPNDLTAVAQHTFLKRLLAIGLTFYLFLIPLQILGFGLNWMQSHQQANQALKMAEAKAENFRTRIGNVQSTEELRSLFGISSQPVATGSNNPSSLAGEQARAVQAVESQLSKLRNQLTQGQRSRMAELSINTARGILGAGIFAFVCGKLRRLWSSP